MTVPNNSSRTKEITEATEVANNPATLATLATDISFKTRIALRQQSMLLTPSKGSVDIANAVACANAVVALNGNIL